MKDGFPFVVLDPGVGGQVDPLLGRVGYPFKGLHTHEPPPLAVAVCSVYHLFHFQMVPAPTTGTGTEG